MPTNPSKTIILIVLFFAIGILLGMNIKQPSKNNETPSPEVSQPQQEGTGKNQQMPTVKTVTGTLTLFTGTYDKEKNLNPVENVDLIILDQEGKILSKVKTAKNGKVSVKLTIPIDKRFSLVPEKEQPYLHGSVTVVSSKEGYTETVIFNAEVIDNDEKVQTVPLVSLNKEGRDSPYIILGDMQHRLESISFVQSVVPAAGLKVYGRY